MTTGSNERELGGRSWPAPLLLIFVWLVGAVLATGIGVLAVRLVATQVGDPAVPPLSAAAANPVPTAGPSSVSGSGTGVPPPPPLEPPAPGPTAPEPRPPAPAARARAFSSSGGTVGVSCSGSVARLLYATPADGYTLDEQTMTGGDVEVRFESGSNRVRLELVCENGAPVLVEERVDPARDGSRGGG